MRFSKYFFLSTLIMSTFTATAPKAYAADPYALQVAKTGDLEMSCAQLKQEAILMRDIIQTTEDLKSDASLNGHAVTAVGAIGSFLIGSVTGGVGLAAAGFLANQQVEGSADDAQDVQSIAQQRRALMVGIHKAKACDNDINIAMTPVRQKSALDLSAHRLASIEPASGVSVSDKNYND